MRKITDVSVTGPKGFADSTPNPAWSAIVEAIEVLDGKQCDFVGIEDSEENLLVIGGGADGRYHVEYSVPGRIYSYFDAAKGSATINVQIGGVLTPLQERHLVDRERVVACARAFYDGALDLSCGSWE
jgi:hypothetical protein